MKDRTAQTSPLTIGQRLVAKWEGADLADAIDDAIAKIQMQSMEAVHGLGATIEKAILDEREACAKIAEDRLGDDYGVAQLIRNRTS